MTRPKLSIEALAPSLDRTAFRSGVPALDQYFLQQAGQDARRRMASCFVLIMDGRDIAGFYTLSATGLALADLPSDLTKRLPRYAVLPATLLGRLAIDERWRGQGLGGLLLADAFRRMIASEIASFGLVVDAKDEAAIAFYEHYGFLRLSGMTQRLILPFSHQSRLGG